jgi:hypothetical protein
MTTSNPISTPKLILLCLVSLALLPLMAVVAVACACGGDKSLLRVLRGKQPESAGVDNPPDNVLPCDHAR